MKSLSLSLWVIPLFGLLPLACNSSKTPTSTSSSATATPTISYGSVNNTNLPKPSHIVIVMEENQNYSTIYPLNTGTNACPYINNTLIAGGALLTNYYGCGHQSEDNYDSLFFANPENAYADPCPNNVGSVPSLANSLLTNGYSFCGYSEDLPSAGSTICSSGNYNIHHSPWAQAYTSVGGNLPVTCGQPFTSFPSSGNYTSLPTLCWVIPNQVDNMHSGTPQAADTWLQTNLGAYATWCQTSSNNSLLIVTWDEDSTANAMGDGSTVGNYSDNHIVAVIYGAMVKTGQYPESSPINHYNLLSTLLGMYSLTQFGNAVGASTITDIFTGASTATSTATPNGPTATPTWTSTSTLTPIPNTPTATLTPGSTVVPTPGSIAFTGLTFNGCSQVSFVSTSALGAGVSIYLSNYSYDATANSGAGGLVDESTTSSSSSTWPGNSSPTTWESAATTITEGTIAYVTGSNGLNAYEQVIIGNTGNASNVLQGGSLYNIAGASGDTWLIQNHNGAGHKVLAWTGAAITVGQPISASVTFLAAVIFGPDSWKTTGSIGSYCFWDSYLPPGLTSGTNAIDLSALWNGGGQDGNLGAYNDSSDQNDNAVLDQCETTLSGICNASNWQADGDESKGNVNLSGPTGVTACASGSAGYTGLID